MQRREGGWCSTDSAGEEDTEQVEGSSHIDDGVSGLRLLSRGKLDDLLGRLQELTDSGPGTEASRSLKAERAKSSFSRAQ